MGTKIEENDDNESEPNSKLLKNGRKYSLASTLTKALVYLILY